MTRVLVNDQEQVGETLPQSWGELLRRLERDAASRGEVVAAIRFDGVDEPAFQAPAQASRTLDTVKVIEVETATPRALVNAALAEACKAADALAMAARQTSAAFRGADLAGAHGRLAELGEGIRSLMMVLDTTSAALGIAIDSVRWKGQPVSTQLRDLIGNLESMITAQQAHDWRKVADILEFDVCPVLESARPVFEALQSRSS
jgi:hypothetical protein